MGENHLSNNGTGASCIDNGFAIIAHEMGAYAYWAPRLGTGIETARAHPEPGLCRLEHLHSHFSS